MTERIKDVWYASIADDKIKAVHATLGGAEHEASLMQRAVVDAKVERVQIEITRIRT